MLRTLFIGALLIAMSSCSTGPQPTTTTAVSIDPTVPAVTTVPVPTPSTEVASTPPSSSTTSTTIESGVLQLEVVAGGDVVELAATLEDEVRLTVYAEVVDEVHVHGYDIHADVAPGEPAVLEFVASIPGIFEVELEDSGSLIAELRVDP